MFYDPQAVLTKVTELVQYHHKLRHNPDKDVAAEGDLVMFRDREKVSKALQRRSVHSTRSAGSTGECARDCYDQRL